MAINTIFRAIIAIFAIGMCIYAFMPAVTNLYYFQDIWDTAPSEMLRTRDNIYTLLQSLPLLAVGVVFIWSYVSIQRKDGGF